MNSAAAFVSPDINDSASALALGIDTGGTQTRWALAKANQDIIASGTAAGLTALQLKSQQGRREFAQVFSDLAAAVRSHGHLQTVRVGITGFSDDMRIVIQEMLSGILRLPEERIRIGNDIEIAYLDSFKPGSGYLVYAGTGSIAAYIDEAGQFHRAGGRGYLLDDGGSGFWIAREAVRHIWRTEDGCPGASRDSLLAQEIFKAIGGDDWDSSKDFMYHRSRGDIGKLALAVAASANADPVAADILKRAGQELARLGMAMCQRFGNKPVVLSGRVLELHPFIAASCRTHLPSEINLRTSICQAHFSAARLAARQLQSIT
ncbi:N-acetylglucosamine kinase [Undibacterium sp. WLX3042]|uniref:N-acetylglucosamine kinase n=1 Tax=Undibacterium sp. WLX3042 TaxID=3412686 RepID=UPI003C2F6751